MVENGNVLVPTMEVYTTGSPKNKTGEDQEGSTCNALLVDTTLVPHGEQPETEESADIFQVEEMVDDRMELIRKTRTTEGLTLENADYLNKATRNSTQRIYNSAWKKWTNWCRKQDPKVDATQYNVLKVIKFLLENKELSSQTLNGIRSAIASVWKVLHPLETPLADQEVIRSFFEAKRKQEVRIPSQEQLMIWDTDILLKNIKKKWLTNGDLELYELQKKAILLLSLATMARLGSDIGRLQKRDVLFEWNKERKISGVTIHFRLPKETQVKSVKIGLIDDSNICPVKTVHTFVERSAKLRSNLPESHTLWLAYCSGQNWCTKMKISIASPPYVCDFCDIYHLKGSLKYTL
ncbi:hypothetical protein G6F46_012580 [Rhizopus delemar]|uniref:Core-binding (CB) domain-containing protein n=2 Tax=Rhizopus TaxID=4842 RepID=A0A9P6YRG6_9FUNG|nr:hypothetical protein G6F55_012860 [Rhizopus delemar]KAG1533487.1 hypothetical protein G6F51_012585 [Rhizopus arrhizus]KAG1497142.1 hypothetical protein G6F53_012034 [Rhizopus delemar]KAG1539339.1 hypothetical protein G6F49_012390 [Rhizopus delemar]KAG1561062.1 hypothetical protein G6F50_012242 [Rhizopus delemar]